MPRLNNEPNPSPVQALNEKERCEMRERVRTERKRDFVGSGRRRDRVGVRERGLKEREN